jgi:hypothetical protein
MPARTSRIMRLPQPRDPDGRSCLPTHHPRSQPPWPHLPTPSPSTTAKPRTCLPAWPASLTRERPVAAATRWWPSWAWRPPRSSPGRGRSPRSPNGPPTHPSRSGPHSAPAAMARPLQRPGRDHHSPHARPAGCRRPGQRHRRLAGRPGATTGAWPTRRPSTGGRRRRQDPARRQRGHRRRPSGPPAGLYGPRQPRGAGPTPGRRRPRRGAAFAPLLDGLDLAGVVVTADALQTTPRPPSS